MSEPTEPTVPQPAPPWRFAAARELGWHLLGVVLTLAILTAGLRLDRADFRAPFAYENDALLILPLVKETVERGSHWRTPRLGAPGTQELHDFPVVDHLHFGIIWLLARVIPDAVVVFNVFYVLTYPLTTATTFFVLRRWGYGVPAALLCGLLYAFQPYHYLRGQVHYFLAAYFVIPLTVMLMLDLCRGRVPLFQKGQRWAGWRTWEAALIAVATASAGAYYAFFSCAFLVVAAAYGTVATRSLRTAACGAFLLALVVAAGVANHAPSFRYQYDHASNARPRQRLAEEAELYGMKMAQLVLPVQGHNPVGVGDRVWVDLAGLRAQYQSPPFKQLNESDLDPIGLVAAAGYLGLLAAACLPLRRGWPLGPLSALALFGTLLGTIGGFGAVFNLVLSPQVRCYNRISIFLAFFALAAVGWAVGRIPERLRLWRWPLCAALLAFGVWDQTNDQWFPDLHVARGVPANAQPANLETARQATRQRYLADAEFFARVEALLPEGMVFTYPFVEYPESRPYQEAGARQEIAAYETVAGYLHTRNLRFSFGAMKGREWDAWQRQVANREPVPRFLERVAVVGFEGLLVDSRGLNPKRWAEMKRDLIQYLGQGALREEYAERGLHFFDLRGYRDTLRKSYGPSGFEARAAAERGGLLALWLKGFTSFESPGLEDRVRWAGKAGQLAFVNRSDTPRPVEVSMLFRTAFQEEAWLTIDSDLRAPDGTRWAASFTIRPEERGPPHVWRFVVPPGQHLVNFRCDPKVPVTPSDSRQLLFTVHDFTMKELPAAPEPP